MKTRIMNVTENILMWTNQYKENDDIYYQFLEQCTEASDTHVKSTVIYQAFVKWFIMNNPQTKAPSSKHFNGNMRRLNRTLESIKFDGKATTGYKNIRLA